MSPPGLVVFSDDWGRHPSSCQHLVARLLNDFSVTWVNTVGTRSIRLDRTTLTRGAQKIRQWVTARRTDVGAEPGPRVLNPRMWPGFGTRASRQLNRALLTRCLLQHVPNLDSSVVLTTIPLVADLLGKVPARQWIYYCVDDFAVWPGLDGDTMRKMEAVLIDRADQIIAAGENLAEQIRGRGRDPMILGHGVDMDRWAVQNAHLPPEPRQLAGLEHPLVLFWGLIDPRLDMGWLDKLNSELSNGTIALVGPEQDAPIGLSALSRVRMLGQVSFDELPAMAAYADVLIMPYRNMPVTRAMQPLKLKEYLATGKPTVVRALPATEQWSDCLDAVDTADDFAAAVVKALRTGIPEGQRTARQRLTAESWSAKADILRRWLLEATAE